jgi:hypothetical protein
MPYYQFPTRRAYSVSLLKILLNYQYVVKWPGVLKDISIRLEGYTRFGPKDRGGGKMVPGRRGGRFLLPQRWHPGLTDWLPDFIPAGEITESLSR